MCHDINKNVFDYIFEKKSDHLILSMSKASVGMLKKGNHIITNTHLVAKNRERLNRDYGLDKYEPFPVPDISDSIWETALSEFARRVLKHYTPDQIIIHEYFSVDKYISRGNDKMLFPFPNNAGSAKANAIRKNACEILKSKIKGCHVIEFPNYVLADAEHKFGLLNLHYTSDYYEYGADALEIIAKRLPDYKEKEALSKLKAQYECKFELTQRNLEIKQWKKKYDSLTALKKLSDAITEVFDITQTAKSITDIELYIELLKTLKSKYLIILAVKDSPGKAFPNVMQKIKELGFTNLSGDWRRMYIGAAYKGEILCDEVGTGVENVEYTNEALKLSVLSSSWERLNKAEITIDGVDYSINIRSLNFVIYDTENKALIDSVGFDNFGSDGKFVRKP